VLDSITPFIVIGITVGSVYGLAALGLVLTYQTTGIFNFAHGAIGALAVFVFYFLHTQHGISWPIAAVLCLGVVAPIAGLILERIARSMAHVAEIYKVTATVGLILIVVGVGNIWYGNLITLVPSFLPSGTFRVAGVYIGWNQAVDEIAHWVKKTREETFFEKDATGRTVNRCEGIAWTGGCTDTNEFNYLVGKAMRSLGVCYLETQARV